MRTVLVLITGIVLSFVVTAALTSLLLPNAGRLIVTMFNTPRSSPTWDRLWIEWQHVGRVTTYVINPLMGLLVGAFVGLAQRKKTVIRAVFCVVPSFLLGVFGDQTRNWLAPVSGVLVYAIHRSLPFLAAAISAYVIARFKHRRMLTPAN